MVSPQAPPPQPLREEGVSGLGKGDGGELLPLLLLLWFLLREVVKKAKGKYEYNSARCRGISIVGVLGTAECTVGTVVCMFFTST